MSTTIPVLVSDSDAAASPVQEPTLGKTRALGPTRGPEQGSVRHLDVGKLKGSVTALTSQLAEVFRDLKAVGDFKLTEVTISVEVSAEGRVILVGKAGVSGGISLKFVP